MGKGTGVTEQIGSKKSIDEVVEWGRNELIRASAVFGIDAKQLVLTVGALSRFYRGLPPSDIDFAARFPNVRPTRGARKCTDKAYTFVDLDGGTIQLLRAWWGEPPYDFDWKHCEAYVTLDDYYFPDCFVTGKLEVGGEMLDPPAPVIRMVKWLNQGFTIDNKQLALLMSEVWPEEDFDALAAGSGGA